MSDITMCDDKKCPSFEKCYRALAPINEWRQSYFMYPPRLPDGVCLDYIPISLRPYDE